MKILAFKAHKHDPLSNIIMAETRSSYCHGAALIDDPNLAAILVAKFNPDPGTSTHLIVEEFWPQARFRFLDSDELSNIDVFDFAYLAQWNATKELQALAYAEQQVRDHLPYDWQDLFRFVAPFRAILGEASADAAKRHQFCSMFVFNMCLAATLRLLNCEDYEFSPNMLDWSPFIRPGEALK